MCLATYSRDPAECFQKTQMVALARIWFFAMKGTGLLSFKKC